MQFFSKNKSDKQSPKQSTGWRPFFFLLPRDSAGSAAFYNPIKESNLIISSLIQTVLAQHRINEHSVDAIDLEHLSHSQCVFLLFLLFICLFFIVTPSLFVCFMTAVGVKGRRRESISLAGETQAHHEVSENIEETNTRWQKMLCPAM